MAVKYVKDFSFDRGFGFTKSADVQHYAKGGHVTKLPAKAKPAAKGMPAKAKPNAPATGAKRMESPPKVGKGQGYKDGGKVPGREMDRQPTKTPPGRGKDVAPSKPFKGAYEGYAKGGKARRYEGGGNVDINPGDGTGYTGETKPDARFGTLYKWPDGDWHVEPYAGQMDIPPPDSPLWAPISRPDDDQLKPIIPLERPDLGSKSGDLFYKWDDGTYHYRPQIFPGQTEEGYDPNRNLPEGLYRDASNAALAAKSQPVSGGLDPFGGRPVKDITRSPEPMQPLESLPRPPDELYARPGPGPSIAYEDPEFYRNHLRKLQAEQAPPSRGYLNPVEGLSGIGRAMRDARGPVEAMRNKQPIPAIRTLAQYANPNMYAKGGHVKGQAKVGKVMSEYKAGELHSGSKKGPLVKNPKQAVAIALSEARKAGAKIPKKADGGVMDAYGNKTEPYRGPPKPKSVSVTKVTKTVSDGKDAAMNERKMLEFLRSLSKDEIADMMEQRAMKAPSMDPDMPKYRKGGSARKSVPAHRGKAMYGGGKC